IQVQNGAPCRLAGIFQILVVVEKNLVLDAATTASAATLAIVAVLGDAQHIEAHQRLHVAHHQPLGGGHEDELVHTAKGRLYLGNTWIIGAAESVDLLQQFELARDWNVWPWRLHRVQVGGWRLGPLYRDTPRLGTSAGNLPRRMSGDFQSRDRDLIGKRV